MANEHLVGPEDDAATESWRRIIAAAAALFAALLLIALIVLVSRSNQERDEALALERSSHEVMMATGGFGQALAQSEAALGRFIISGDQGVATIYYDEWVRAGRLLDRLNARARYYPAQGPLLEELQLLFRKRGEELSDAAQRANYRRNWQALSSYYQAGKLDTGPRIAVLLRKITANERALLSERSKAAAASIERSNRLVRILSIIGLFIVTGAILLGWTAISAIRQRHLARRLVERESARAETLQTAVADRTRELEAANIALREEAATRIAAEAQLRQAQKMEAVGQLTGGIAHDFNNMLAVVVGGLDLARRRLTQETEVVQRHLDNAMEGATRAAELTRRLLAFARAEPLLPEQIDLGELIKGMSSLLDRSLGEIVRIETDIEPGLWQVHCDRSQVENAILNLAVNARDAMPEGGVLRIAASNQTLADGEAGEAAAGRYVRIRVTDEGCGIAPQVLERVFEPFFTTKEVGKGTGLGLSQIFGFARQSGGDVTIDSTVGIGTTVSLYLPRRAEALTVVEDATPRQPSGPAPIPDEEAILVVEDDRRVRMSTIAALEELGYRTIACESGEEAIVILARRRDIRLIVTDIVMPGMSGTDLVATVAPLYPHVGVLFVTGYTGDAGGADKLAGYQVLRKPFTIARLSAAVNAALSRPVGTLISGSSPARRAEAAE